MKKILLIFSLAVIMQNSKAGVWLVDNNVIQPGVLTNISDAIDSAFVGDTIMVEGGGGTYGDIFITKPLVLIGEGYNDPLSENTIVDNVHFRSSNVYFSGFYSNNRPNLDALNAPGSTLSDIIIERCYFSESYFFVGNPTGSPLVFHNIQIRNTISRFRLWIAPANGYVQFDSLIVENNIFYWPWFANWGVNVTGTATCIFRNNLFFNGDNGQNGNTLFHETLGPTDLHDAILYNNIFYDCNPSLSNNCTFMNNLTYGNGTGANAPFGPGANDTLPGPQNNNIYGQDPLFVTNSSGGLPPFSYSLDFHLQTGSPCIGTGVGGTDIGIYGGYYPFIISAGPKIPVVDYLDLSKYAVPQGSSFFLEFNARVRK